MTPTVFVRPREGLRLRMPSGDVFPAEGTSVPLCLYVQRRLDDGDLVEAAPPAEATEPAGPRRPKETR